MTVYINNNKKKNTKKHSLVPSVVKTMQTQQIKKRILIFMFNGKQN